MSMKRERLYYLDLIKIIAALSVFGCHFTRSLEMNQVGYSIKIIPDYIFNIYIGNFGVSLFFIISGAALMYVYDEKIKLVDYYKKRFLGIYPMFWIAYISAFLYNFWLNRGVTYKHPKITFLLTLFGMDGYLGFYVENYYLLGEWFLGCLIFLYLSFPILLLFIILLNVFDLKAEIEHQKQIFYSQQNEEK